jgi:hypothetical protein
MSRTKQRARIDAAVMVEMSSPDYCPPEHLYADMRQHITPRIRARAAAEWAAMDDRGQLPEGWVNPYDLESEHD